MSNCAARGCGKPTQTMLCKDCLAQLVDALRNLAYGGVQRRADPIEFEDDLDEHSKRTGRKRPTDSRVIIPEDDNGKQQLHRAYLPADQTRRQGLLADLQDTVTRLDHLGPAGGGKVRGRGDVTTVEFHVAASHLADKARSTISVWAREVWEANRHLHLPRTYVEACEWMAGLAKVLAVHPSAGAIHDAITGLAERVRRMVDLAPDLTYLGICSGVLRDGQLCDWDLYAEQDDTVVQCPRCGETHEVLDRKDRMIKAMQDQLLAATDLRTVLTRYMPQGVPPIGTIHRWASIGKLTKKPPLPGDNRPRYRVGDVLDLIAKQQQDDNRNRGNAS